MAVRSILDEVLEAWAYTRSSVIREIQNLRERDLRMRPHPESRTAAEIAIHIVESGLMMVGELSRSDGDFRRRPHPELIREHSKGEALNLRSAERKSELVQLLKRTHANGARTIRDRGELHMLQLIRRFDGEHGTRLAWMSHGISHEEYHRGQLALYARLSGRVPALTQRIRGQN